VRPTTTTSPQFILHVTGNHPAKAIFSFYNKGNQLFLRCKKYKNEIVNAGIFLKFVTLRSVIPAPRCEHDHKMKKKITIQ